MKALPLLAFAATLGLGPAALAQDRPSVLIEEADRLNDLCRGGSGDDPRTQAACDERERVGAQVRALGWCWGRLGQIGADRRWQRCEDRPAAGTETEIPRYDVEGRCAQIGRQSAGPSATPPQIAYKTNACLRTEQEWYDALRFIWPRLSSGGRAMCLRAASQTIMPYQALGGCALNAYDVEARGRPHQFRW